MDVCVLDFLIVLVALISEVGSAHISDACRGLCENVVNYYCDSYNAICTDCQYCRASHRNGCVEVCNKWKSRQTTTVKPAKHTIPMPNSTTMDLSTTLRTTSHLGSSTAPHVNTLAPTVGDGVTEIPLYPLLSLFMIGVICLVLGYKCWYKGGFKWLVKRCNKEDPPEELELGEVRENRPGLGVEEQGNLLPNDHDGVNGNSSIHPVIPGYNRPLNSVEVSHGELRSDKPFSPELYGERRLMKEEITSASYGSGIGRSDSGFGSTCISRQPNRDVSEIGPLLSHEPGTERVNCHPGGIPEQSLTREVPRGAVPTNRTPPPTPTQDGSHHGHILALGGEDYEMSGFGGQRPRRITGD